VPEQEKMAKEVQISKGLLTGLVAALIFSLIGVAYLLGRQSVTPIAQSTPASTVTPVTLASNQVASQTTEPSLSARLDRIERRVDRTAVRIEASDTPPVRQAPPRRAEAPTRTSSPPPAAIKPRRTEAPLREQPSADMDQRRAYFQQVDSILQNTASIDDPNQFATKFLQQAMSGDTSGFDNLSATTRQAKNSLESVQPPPSCKQHHALLVSQLSQSIVLLTEVNQAIRSNDTSKLSSVAARGQEMQADTEKFKQLDRNLRRGL
jgi:hypothetical protein